MVLHSLRCQRFHEKGAYRACVASVLQAGMSKQMKAADDPASDEHGGARKDNEQFHQRERRCRARAQARGAQPETGATDHEIKEHDRRNGDHDNKQRNQASEEQSHKRHTGRLHRDRFSPGFPMPRIPDHAQNLRLETRWRVRCHTHLLRGCL